MISSFSPARVIVGTPVETLVYQSSKDPTRNVGLPDRPAQLPQPRWQRRRRETATRFAPVQAHRVRGRWTPGAGRRLVDRPSRPGHLDRDDHIVTLWVRWRSRVDRSRRHRSRGIRQRLVRHPVAHHRCTAEPSGPEPGAQPARVLRNRRKWRLMGHRRRPRAAADATSDRLAVGQRLRILRASSGHPADPQCGRRWRTYVLADLPRAVATTAQLEIDRTGLDPVVAPFSDVGVELDRTLAAYAFSERLASPRGSWQPTALSSPRGPNEDRRGPGIIEIIDDDGNPFGDRAQSHTIHDSGGPRWVGPAAAAALAAIIGYGIATSASSGVPQVAPPPSTTVAPATTTIAPPTTVTPPSTTLVPYSRGTPAAPVLRVVRRNHRARPQLLRRWHVRTVGHRPGQRRLRFVVLDRDPEGRLGVVRARRLPGRGRRSDHRHHPRTLGSFRASVRVVQRHRERHPDGLRHHRRATARPGGVHQCRRW